MTTLEIKEELIRSVLELISKKSVDQISIREIAKEAGVNSAAISYYFGGKDNLILEAMKVYWEELCTLYKSIFVGEITRERAEAFCYEIFGFCVRSKGITQAEQKIFEANRGIDEDTKGRIALQFNAMGYLVKALRPELEEEMIPIKVVRLMSALSHPVIWMDMADQILPAEMALDVFIRAYIKDVVDTI